MSETINTSYAGRCRVLPNGNIEYRGGVITPERLQEMRDSLDPQEGLLAMSIDEQLGRIAKERAT